MSSQVRFCSWTVLDRDYAPVEFTSPSILAQAHTNLVDPDLKRTAALIVFNDYDPNSGVDRRSYTGYYKVADGIPRNPVRRTGLTGRGCLPRWGPNHQADPIITRWQRDSSGQVVVRSGSPVLEVLVSVVKDTRCSLPFGPIAPGALLPHSIFPVIPEKDNFLPLLPGENRMEQKNLTWLLSCVGPGLDH